jgi:hypothetical protein
MTAFATMKEKAEMLRQEKLLNSYAGREMIEMEQGNIGRFAKPENSKSPLPVYPRLPESSPWHHDPVPPEEPLGYSVDAMEPVGSQQEVQASIDRLNENASVASISDAGAARDADPSTGVDRALAPQSKLIRRLVR